MGQRCSKEKWEAEEKKIIEEMSRHEIASECEPWEKSTCPHCNAQNWILMTRDMEACKCYKCEKTFWISEKIHEDYKINLIMGQVFDFESKKIESIFKGMEKPD